MEFKQWLEYDDLDDYVDPDYHLTRDVVSSRTVAFIYTSEGRMYYGDRNDQTHNEIIDRSYDLQERYKKFLITKYGYNFERIDENDLLGRLGPHTGNIVVSFWNDKINVLNKLLVPCLNQLEKDKLINKNKDLISTLNHKTMRISDLMDEIPEVSPEDAEKQKLMRQLHLMAPNQKKIAMQKLGLGSPKQSPWKGSLTPGQKHWALNSEGKNI